MRTTGFLAAATIFCALGCDAQTASRVTAISAGGQHNLALTEDGTVLV